MTLTVQLDGIGGPALVLLVVSVAAMLIGVGGLIEQALQRRRGRLR